MTEYNTSGNPVQSGRALSKPLRDEYLAIKAAVSSKANSDNPVLTGDVVVPTRTAGSTGSYAANLDWVAAEILAAMLSGTLPGQTGNDYKILRTVSNALGWSDDYVRKLANSDLSAAINTSRATVASHATASDIWAALGNEIDFTGAATITDFPDAPQAGASRILHCSGACTFTHNANITVPGGQDYNVVAGDIIEVHAITTTTFKIRITPSIGILRSVPIFNTATTTLQPITSHEDITSNYNATGLASGDLSFIYKESLWVGFSPFSAKGNVATAVDGSTWILRAMPSSQKWSIGYDGANFLAIGLGALVSASSADGITWSSKTSVTATGFADDTANAPVSLAANVFVALKGAGGSGAGGSGEVWHTIDGGTTWTTEDLPAVNNSNGFYNVNGFYWYWNSSTAAYTSTTGLTGSWTARTLPVAPASANFIQQNPDGSLMIQTASEGDVYRTTDGINWTQVIGLVGAPTDARVVLINGIYTIINESLSMTMHGGKRQGRAGTMEKVRDLQHRINDNGSGLFLMSSNVDRAIRIDNSITGIFF